MTAAIHIVCHSAFEHTKLVATTILAGAQDERIRSTLLTVEQASSDLLQFDRIRGIVFGRPTYMGGPSSQFKAFAETTRVIWSDRGWKDELAAGLTNSGARGCDGEVVRSPHRLAGLPERDASTAARAKARRARGRSSSAPPAGDAVEIVRTLSSPSTSVMPPTLLARPATRPDDGSSHGPQKDPWSPALAERTHSLFGRAHLAVPGRSTNMDRVVVTDCSRREHFMTYVEIYVFLCRLVFVTSYPDSRHVMSHSSRPLVPPSSFPPSPSHSAALDPRCGTRAPRTWGGSLVVSLSLLSIGCYHGLEQDDLGTSPWGGPMQSDGGTGGSPGEDGGSVPTGGNDGVDDDAGRPGGSSGAADGLDESDGTPTEDTGEPLPPPMLPAGGISVTAVEVNQGVSIPVVDDGTLIDVESRNAPLVRNRHMLVRVYWERQADFEPRLLDAVLTLDHGNDQVEELVDSRMIDGPPSQDSLNGTFSFVLEPSQVTPNMQFSVGIYEPDQTPSGAVASPLFPADGTAPLGVPDTPMQISLTIVPYRVGNTSPNLSPSAVEEFRAHFYAMQPIEFGDDGLRLTIHPQEQSAPYSDAQVVLNSVCSLWDNDVSSGFVDGSEYYQSAVASNTTSGVLGVAYVLNNPNGGPRCGSNLWDTNLNQGPSTMTHEIGHNQGRPHAPCGGVANPDPGYPYGNGSIGVQGWNPVTGQLISSAADYMSYCNPDWVSDYNYRLNAIRNAALQTNANAYIAGAPSEPPLVVVGHQMTTGDVEWSVYRSASSMEALTPAGTATISTVDGYNVDVTLYERELSEGSSVVGIVDGIEHADEIAWIDSGVFGAALPVAPTALLSP